jgi:hypothetical protein
VKYVSDYSGPPIPSPNSGFWVHEDTVHDVTDSSHVRFLIEHSELFDIPLDDIRATYRKNYETVPAEGRARDELIKIAASKGWVRVRHYSKPKDYWSIQADSTEKRKQTIQEFIRWAIESKVMHEHESAVIAGFDDPRDRREFRWDHGGLKRYLDQ